MLFGPLMRLADWTAERMRDGGTCVMFARQTPYAHLHIADRPGKEMSIHPG